ncbi:hypothetical protein [Actinomadura sp. 6N118]|uniref:hypothetical protein n=1 Tax=Actinomadura sp. 6N118 TaxID=3375151 RepID=UPI00379FBB98
MTKEKLPPERTRDLCEALAAYNLLLDEVVTDKQYWLLGRRQDNNKIAAYGSIIERAAARQREREQAAQKSGV